MINIEPRSCWTRICPAFANSVDPDQLASALFVITYVSLNQQPGSSNLIGWQLEVGRVILIYLAWQG